MLFSIDHSLVGTRLSVTKKLGYGRPLTQLVVAH